MDVRQTEALAGWWATLSQEQRAEAKAAPESGDYPRWLVDALNKCVGKSQIEAWWVGDDDSPAAVAMRRDVVEWLRARDD